MAHVYPGCSLELMQALRARGHIVFLERWGEMDHAVKRVTEDAFARAGWPFEHYTYLKSQAHLDLDQARTEAADFIFSPGPPVTSSLLERGIPEARILKTSYGWDPQRFKTTMRALPEIRGVTVLFVGRIGITKGAHLLLNAWSRAGIDGRLVLLGEMEPMIPKYCGDHLSRPDVMHLPYNYDPAPVYRSADVFALPTLTEGSPLVSYEAMGNGLPLVISPMGAGSIVRHGKEGFVVDPYDLDGWVAALRQLATDTEMRRAIGDAGRIRAAEFTWDKVAGRRYEFIKEALSRPVGQT
jgi:glycosyltransferase involved in cell wall biosynthesis